MYKETLLLLTLTALLAVECLGESHGNLTELVERDNDKGQEDLDLVTNQTGQNMLNKRYGHLIEPVQGLKIQRRVTELDTEWKELIHTAVIHTINTKYQRVNINLSMEHITKQVEAELKEQVTELVHSSMTLYQLLAPRLIKHKDGLKIQQRVDGSVDFYRNWDEYVEGFGDPNTNFWLGLETIHKLSEGGVKLRVDLWFTGEGYKGGDGVNRWERVNYNNEHKYAEYKYFSIDSAATNYRLHVSGYHGTAGNAFNNHNGFPFTTKDRDNDGRDSGNCAVDRTGSWWYNSCADTNLNGEYGAGDWKGPHWWYFTRVNPASRVEMMISI